MLVVGCGKKCSNGSFSSAEAALLSMPAGYLVVIPLHTNIALLGRRKVPSVC